MTILVFPDNPTLGQKVTIDDREWTWDGERWLKIGGTGYQGSAGYFGSTGLQGSVGYKGSKGEDGLPGGPTGFTGSKGDTGDRGEIGYTGSSGAFAGVGYTGSSGNVGYDGSQGIIGYSGSKGDKGFTGSRGLQGVAGYSGSSGYNGSVGYTGSRGIGDTGFTGSRGLTGSRGEQGVAGAPRLVEFLYGNGSNTIFDLQYTAVLPMHLFVMVNGLVQMPYVDYTVNVNTISFISAPSDQADIEIRYFDQAGFTGSVGDKGPEGFRGSVGYRGSRGDVGYVGSPGVQGPEGEPGPPGGADGFTGSRGYNGSSGFTGSMGSAGAPKHSQQEVGDGVNAIFTLDYNVTDATHILVMVNGLVQLPVIDYDLAGTDSIVFTNIPEDQADIEIRFFQATGFDGSRGDIGYRGSTGYTGSKGPDGNPGGADGYTGSMGYTGSTGIGIPGPVGAPHTSQVFQTDGVANTFTLREIVFDPRHIFVMVNGLVQLPGVDYNLIGVDLVDDEVPPETPYDQDIEYVTTTGSTEIQFAVAPPINSDVEIRYFKVVGFAGSVGDSGYQGSAGYDGSVGYSGSIGGVGPTGYQGSAGFRGSQGTTSVFVSPNPPPDPSSGTVWWDSDNGILNFFYAAENTWVGVSEGAQGFTGSQGLQGPAGGYTGSIGLTGSVGYGGSKGELGYTGSQGVGYTGSQGLPGEFAAVGFSGSVGFVGSFGYTGSIGAGYTGSIGYTGSAGTGGGGGVGLSPRLSNTVSTSAGSANATLGLAKTFAVLKIATTGSAWVRLYADSTSRSSDLGRVAGDEPSADAGVIAEVITSGNETVRFTPAAIGWNDDDPTSNNIYLRITNYTSNSINTTITYVPLES